MIQLSLRTILVATDLGDGSEEVVGSAAALAEAAGAELHVLHILDLDSSAYRPEKEAPAPSFADRIAHAERALREQVHRLVPAAVPVHQRVVNYVAHRAIAEHAEDVSADLIVLGAHRRGGGGAQLLGTTADRVVRTATVPCLVVRGPLAVPFRRIGVPTDFSEPARGALDVAMAWASRLIEAPGAGEPARPELRVFHVGWVIDQAAGPSPSPEVLLPRLEQEVKEALRRSGGADEPPVRWDVVWEVSPAAGITSYAREHDLDLLVMGTHGYGGLSRILIGSVASGVARSAPCPVLLVPPGVSHERVTGREAWEARARLERILVAVDFAEPSVDAARWTVHHFAPGAEHHFIHVLDLDVPPAFLGGPTARREELLRETREAADSRLREWARSLVKQEPVVLREGEPSEEISRAARELQVDLVVVGEHGHGGIRGWLGSSAERLLASSPAALLLAQRLPPGPPRQILAAVDESDLSVGVLVWANLLSRRFGAPLQVIYALDLARYASPLVPGGSVPSMGAQEEGKAAALRWLNERAQEAGLIPEAVRIEVVAGEAGASIIDTAIREKAELIVMGSRGAGTAGRLVLGSVSRTVLRQAPCPVLAVRDPAWSHRIESEP